MKNNKIISNMGIFNRNDEDEDYDVTEHYNNSEETDGEYLVDIAKPIQQPNDFDTLCALINHYEDMEQIVSSLKLKTAELAVNENPNDKDADYYIIDSEYVELFITILENKMTEIRNVLNYN